MRDSMIFYRSFYESLNGMTATTKAEVYSAIFRYGLDFQEPEFTDEIARALFTLIKPQIDANIKRFTNGNKPKVKQKISKIEAKDKQEISKSEANNNVNVNDNVNKNNNIEIRKQKFADSLKPFLGDYDKNLLNDFYLYWSETTLNNKKMKFELEKTFSLERRLNTWRSRSVDFNKPKQLKSNDELFYENVMKQLGK
jgi:hypothetical protein